MVAGSQWLRPTWVYGLVLALVSVIVIYGYGGIDYAIPPYANWDLRSYWAMAEAAPRLAAGVHEPFVYRLLGPYLVGLLPLPEPVGFRLVTVVATFTLALSLYAFLLRCGISVLGSFLTIVLMLLNRSLIGYTVWNYFQSNDMLSLVFLVVLFWSMYARRWGVYGLVLLLGAATRETALLIVPVTPIYLLESRSGVGDWRRWAMATAPALAAFSLLRLFIEPGGGPGLWQSLLLYAPKLLLPETWYRLLVNPFVPLTFVPFVFFKESRAYLQERKHLVFYGILVLASSLFGQNNERLIAPAIVAFYPLVASILDRAVGGRLWMVGIILVGSVLASLHHQLARFPLPGREWSVFLSLGSLAMVTSACVFLVLVQRRATDATTC